MYMSFALAKNWGSQPMSRKNAFSGRSFRLVKMTKKCAKKTDVDENSSLKTRTAILTASLIVVGAAYLYQVNGIATKGYEIREKEAKIQELKKESQQLKIKEVELRSMYNIEKAMDDLNLVTSPGVSYLEENGPMAMK
jgi:hypothetical protein